MQRKPFVLGVAGGTGSGKTTVSRRIRNALGAEHIAYLQHDSYYHDHSYMSPAERARCNYDHPDSLDTELMVEHLQNLIGGRGVEIPIYDFASHVRLPETRRVAPAEIILVEGILIFVEPELLQMMDMRVYVDTAADIRFIRRLRRDVNERGRTLESIVDQYLSTVRPMHLEFVEPSKRHADVIVPEGGNNRVAMDMIVSRLKAELERS